MSKGYTPVEGEEGWKKTDMHCHACSKGFIGEFDFSVNGQHIVLCPRCGHEHCRVIENGKITGERWDSRSSKPKVKGRSFWKSDSGVARSSTAAQYLRDLWLNRADART